jgi:Zn2+/Cd2+-exporting ATPase
MNARQKWTLGRILTAMAILIGLEFFPAEGWLRAGLYLIPYFIIGYDILRQAIRGIVQGEIFDENFLMAIATAGAMFLGEYREGAAVMLFYQVGELFQSLAVGRSRASITALMDIRPDYANRELGGAIERVDPDEVVPGTVIVVRPGEKVPIDGIVLSGTASLDMHALTGESLPRDVGPGAAVLSGCINLSGVLRVRTTKAAEESTAAKILELVENSSMKKSRAENFITRFARVYTPAVCLGAFLLAVGMPVGRLLLGEAPLWSAWLERALVLLVISCPCALVISIPLSFFGGIGAASAKGILVKGSNYLEALAQINYVVFDKTGTLTRGVFEVTEVKPQGMSKDELLAYAAGVERYSQHPISRSLQAAFPPERQLEEVTGYEELSGYGVRAMVSGHSVAAGNARFMKQLGLGVSEALQSGTVVHVAVDGRYAGSILVSDVVKPQAAAAVDALKKAGVRRTVMLTGDTPNAAAVVAAAVGVDAYEAGLLPADKVTAVEKLLAGKGFKEKLAFVGDGINDAPVLARADVGIAMGALGSDAAIEAADVVLMDDDPVKISLGMAIARKTLRIVRQNIVLALGVKAVFLIFGAIGLANMWAAIFADVGVMILAVLNAMRIFLQPQTNAIAPLLSQDVSREII